MVSQPSHWHPTFQLPVVAMADSRVNMADGPPAKKVKTASPATAPGLDSSGTILDLLGIGKVTCSKLLS